MLLAQVLQLADDALLPLQHRLAAGEAEQRGGVLQEAPDFQAAQALERLALPLADVGFDQRGAEDDRQPQALSQRGDRLDGALQRAAVDGFDGGSGLGFMGPLWARRRGLSRSRGWGQPLSQCQGLALAALIQMHAGQAAGQDVFLGVIVLAVTDEKECSHI